MKHVVAVIVVVALFTVPTLAQLSAAEAQQRMAQRDAQRQAERDKLVQIPQGELDDMRAEIKRLQSELRALKEQANGGTKAPAATQKARESIEVGMTREDVAAFVQSHRGTMRLAPVVIDRGAAPRGDSGAKPGDMVKVERLSPSGRVVGETMVTFENGKVKNVSGQ